MSSFGHTQPIADPKLIFSIRFKKPLYWWEKGGRDCGRLRRFGDSDTKDQLRISNRLCVAEAWHLWEYKEIGNNMSFDFWDNSWWAPKLYPLCAANLLRPASASDFLTLVIIWRHSNSHFCDSATSSSVPVALFTHVLLKYANYTHTFLC